MSLGDIGSSNPAAGFRPSSEDGKSGPGIDFNPNQPIGPAPAVTSFATASAQTMAQKQALLDAIAQQGTAGKQLFANQQAALNDTRGGAIQSQLQGSLAANPQYGLGGDLGLANQRSAQATAMAQGAIGDLSNSEARGNANYYDAINAQIPIAQAHTQQQVNAIKARQDQAAQAYAAEQARLAEEAQMARETHAMDMQKAQVELENSKAQKPLSALQLAQLALDQQKLDAGNDKAQQTPQQQALLQDAINHLGGPGSHGFNTLTFVISHAKSYADAVNGLNTVLNSSDPAFHTPRGGRLDQNTLLSYLQRYYGISGK